MLRGIRCERITFFAMQIDGRFQRSKPLFQHASYLRIVREPLLIEMLDGTTQQHQLFFLPYCSVHLIDFIVLEQLFCLTAVELLDGSGRGQIGQRDQLATCGAQRSLSDVGDWGVCVGVGEGYYLTVLIGGNGVVALIRQRRDNVTDCCGYFGA